MASPLLPTHARGAKPKRKGSGAKEVMYIVVALIVGYLVFVSWQGNRGGGGEDLQDREGDKQSEERVLQSEEEGVRPEHQAGKHLERQNAMKRVEELRRVQAIKRERDLASPNPGSVQAQAAASPVPVNVEQHEQQHVPEVTSFFDLSAVDIDGNTVHFSKYAGKVVVVVNVASACGYTDQNYKGLQSAYDKYKEHGVEILGFPCNQFGGQESKSESEIKAFCSGTYHVTFPMFSKVEVNGPNTHPVYQFLKKQLPVSEGGGGGTDTGRDLGWNFFKFLVDSKGQPVKLFHQTYDAGQLEHAIYSLLQPPAATSPTSLEAHAGTVEEHPRELATLQQSPEAKVPEAKEFHTLSVPSPQGGAVEVLHATDAAPDLPKSFFDLSAVDIDGNTVHFSKYAGKVVVVVNVASACGYTDQNYKGLERTYLKYKEHGVEILGFPCNQFGGQESKSESEIKAFCSGTYHVTFPMFSKVEVNGPNTHPVYQFLKKQLPVSEGGGGGTDTGRDLGWNFFKFLVDKKGQPAKLFHQELEVPLLQEELYRLLHE